MRVSLPPSQIRKRSLSLQTVGMAPGGYVFGVLRARGGEDDFHI